MSVEARQGVKYSIVGYFGAFLGMFSTFFIFPNDLEFYGKLRYIYPAAEMILPLIVFGLSYSNVKFFHETQSEGKHQNVLSLSLLAAVVNFLIFVSFFFLLVDFFPSWKGSALWEMRQYVFPLILILAISAIFNKYLSNYKRIAIANIFENIFPKLANLGAFIAFYYIGVTENFSYVFFLTFFVVSMLGYYFYTNKLERFVPDFNIEYVKQNNLWKRILEYSFYGFLGNLGNFVSIRINNFMIGEYIGFQENGLYSTIYSIVALIAVPSLGIYNVYAPTINKNIVDKNLVKLGEHYQKVSLHLFLIGIVFLTCILVGFPFLTEFMSKSGALLKQNEVLLWIMGGALLFDLSTGFNSQIISLSKYYRFNIFVMLILAATTVLLNIYFIKNTDLGILGVAIASSFSLLMFNIIKVVFIYQKFGFLPFSRKMLYAFVLCSVAFVLVKLVPDFSSNFLNLFFKPALLLLFILIGNHFMKIYPLKEQLNKTFIKSLFKS